MIANAGGQLGGGAPARPLIFPRQSGCGRQRSLFRTALRHETSTKCCGNVRKANRLGRGLRPHRPKRQGAEDEVREIGFHNRGGRVGLDETAAHAQDVAPPPPPQASPWYDAISFKAFVDAYASVNYNFPEAADEHQRAARLRRETTAGVAHLGRPGCELRPGARRRHREPALRAERQHLCRPGRELRPASTSSGRPRRGSRSSKLQLDFGKFDTIYGAEVADGQNNFNSRAAALYWLAQPLFHTGLRASYAITDQLGLKALVVNGWNNTVDNNAGKTYGLQARLHAKRHVQRVPRLDRRSRAERLHDHPVRAEHRLRRHHRQLPRACSRRHPADRRRGSRRRQ